MNLKYKIKVFSIQEIGQRENQEDSLFPAHGQVKAEEDRLFILCDGMGGHDCGEIASQTVCQAMSEILKPMISACESVPDSLITNAVYKALDALDEVDNGAPKKMGTTMTLLALHRDGYTIAHIGDSRVYHFRPGATENETFIIHKTEDHSLVNYLISTGRLTVEEAKHSKQRNVIIRAMQPNSDPRPTPDIYHSEDIQQDDYFYLCSDGMLEHMDDDNLRFIMSRKVRSDEEKVIILTRSTSQNKDNHAAFLIHIMDVVDEDSRKVLPFSSSKEHKEQKRKNRQEKYRKDGIFSVNQHVSFNNTKTNMHSTEMLDIEKQNKTKRWMHVAMTTFFVSLAILFLLLLIYYRMK